MTIPQATGRVHIVLLGVSATPIGGYKVAYEYANALARLGTPVTVWHSHALVGFHGSKFSWSRALRPAVGWWLRGAGVFWRKHGVPWFRFEPRVEVRATAWLPPVRSRQGDAILATAVETTPFVGRLGHKSGARTAALIQHFETWAEERSHILHGWSQVDERIVIAPWLQDLCDEAGMSSVYLPNALEVPAFPPGPLLEERPLRVLSLLSPHTYKRPDVVMAALTALIDDRRDVEAVAFGQTARPDQLDGRIRYIQDPPHDTLTELYRSSRVYMCGSDAEGWHLPPAEASLSGAAVVSTDIGGVRASMSDDALYAPPGDPQALAEQVMEALDNPAAAQARVDRARKRLASTSYEDNAKRLQGVLFPGTSSPQWLSTHL
ncbi:glycosyltransferase family 4 protein [Microbacterium sp. NPDC090007]|uniref:glycosyltransferase family 4 protein n=1 Tax=Microbacterium sp. NPDC090007 TaxID=3364204 RepID=UPI0037F5B5D7